MRLPQPRSPAGAKSCTPGTWGYRAAATAAWASSTVLRWGNTRPYTPVSSACLITHWSRSRAFGGIRTIGTTSGCRLPFSAILLRFSSTCREVRRVVKLKPSCSISMMTQVEMLRHLDPFDEASNQRHNVSTCLIGFDFEGLQKIVGLD